MTLKALREAAHARNLKPNGKFPSSCNEQELREALEADGYFQAKPPWAGGQPPILNTPTSTPIVNALVIPNNGRTAEEQNVTTEGPEEAHFEEVAIPKPAAPVDAGAAFLQLMNKLFATEIDKAQPALREYIERYIDERGRTFAPRVEIQIDEQVNTVEGISHAITVTVIKSVLAGMDVLLVGPSGCGKTYLAHQVAQAVGRRFGSMSITAGISEAYLLGRFIPGVGGNYEYRPAPFVDFYRDGGVYLLDEIDAGDPNVLLVINSALANGHLSLPNGETIERHPKFTLIATGNTWGTGANRIYAGRSQLDAATLDRFVGSTFLMDYDQHLEAAIARGGGGQAEALLLWIDAVRRCVSQNQIRRVVSTRYLAKSVQLLQIGTDLTDLKQRLVVSWSENELAALKRDGLLPR